MQMRDSLAQLAEHLTFNQGVRGSNPRWVTTAVLSKAPKGSTIKSAITLGALLYPDFAVFLLRIIWDKQFGQLTVVSRVMRKIVSRLWQNRISQQ